MYIGSVCGVFSVLLGVFVRLFAFSWAALFARFLECEI